MKKNLFKKIAVSGLIIATIYSANRFLFNNIIQNSITGLYRNIGLFMSQKFSSLPNYARAFLNRSKVADENELLKKRNIELEGQIISLKAVEKENESLKKQLGVQQKKSMFLIEGKIFSIERGGLTSTLLIDKGKNDGIEVSMAVIAGGNVLVGVTSEVFDDYSKVILLDDLRSQISVRIGNLDVIGTAKGLAPWSGKIYLDFITNKDEIAVGDMITTSGLDNFYEALIVGKISKVAIKGGNLFKEVEAELSYDIKLGPNLFIVVN